MSHVRLQHHVTILDVTKVHILTPQQILGPPGANKGFRALQDQTPHPLSPREGSHPPFGKGTKKEREGARRLTELHAKEGFWNFL